MADSVLPAAVASPINVPNIEDHGSLDSAIIISSVPNPIFVSAREGGTLRTSNGVVQLPGFRVDGVLEQPLSRFISSEKTRGFGAVPRDRKIIAQEKEVEKLATRRRSSAWS